MENSYIVAHDVGTTSNKAVLVRPNGAVVGFVRAAYPTYHPRPGWIEQRPTDWWAAVCSSTQELLRSCSARPEQILCITFSTQMLGVIPMGGDGQPLCPAIIWSDSRAHDQAQQLMRRLFSPRIFEFITGATASSKDVVPKLLWIRQREHRLFLRTDKFLDVNGYLIYRCTGEMMMDWSAASATGLFDVRSKQWQRTLAHLCRLPLAKLPPLRPSTDIAGVLQPIPAHELGLLPGTPVVCGAGDVVTAAVGAGSVRDGTGHIYLGTSGWVGVIRAGAPASKHGVAVLQSAEADKSLQVGATESAGAAFQWIGGVLFHERSRPGEQDVFQMMDRAIGRVAPGSQQLLFTPWLYGERLPVVDTLTRAALINLSPYHTHEHMVRAVCEGVAYNFRWILEIMQNEFDYHQDAIRIVGGGAQSDAWAQIIADVTGKRIERVGAPQAAGAVGAALIAAVALGLYPDYQQLESLIHVDRVFQPQPGNREVYNPLFAMYQQLYTALKPIYRQLNKA